MLEDGTKIRYNPLDHFKPDFPESIDMKICNRCDRGCRMCHECSTPDGALADLNAPFLDTLRPYTELAIGGGNPLEHPGLTEFLMRMKKQKKTWYPDRTGHQVQPVSSVLRGSEHRHIPQNQESQDL